MILEELYHDLILEHARHPKNRGELPPPARTLSLLNPLCGDELGLSLSVADGKIVEARFSGHGCTISQAAGSMFTEVVKGKTEEEARKLAADFRLLLHGELGAERRDALGELVALEGVKNFPTRLKCALLAGEVLTKLLKS